MTEIAGPQKRKVATEKTLLKPLPAPCFLGCWNRAFSIFQKPDCSSIVSDCDARSRWLQHRLSRCGIWSGNCPSPVLWSIGHWVQVLFSLLVDVSSEFMLFRKISWFECGRKSGCLWRCIRQYFQCPLLPGQSILFQPFLQLVLSFVSRIDLSGFGLFKSNFYLIQQDNPVKQFVNGEGIREILESL